MIMNYDNHHEIVFVSLRKILIFAHEKNEEQQKSEHNKSHFNFFISLAKKIVL